MAAASAARRVGVGSVLVIERERDVGGIPRHSNHTGYGLRDLHRLMTGPVYARELTDRAIRNGVEIVTESSVTGWRGERTVAVTSPSGIEEIEAGALILTTGCRERPRAARLVPGTRPAGVFTTGSLQQLVHLSGDRIGERAVIVGAEHVSFSAVLTLRRGGARVLALVTAHPRDQTYLPLKLATAGRMRARVITGSRVTRIEGRDRIEAVEITDDTTGATRQVACDTVVFTGDWIPDGELARLGGLDMDPSARGPRIDAMQRTSRPGVFAAGNLVHAAETADTASRCGTASAYAAKRFLRQGGWPSAAIPIDVRSPLAWISPNAFTPSSGEPPHGHFLMRVDRFERNPCLTVRQGERELWSRRYRRMIPARPIRVSASWIRDVLADGPPISVLLE